MTALLEITVYHAVIAKWHTIQIIIFAEHMATRHSNTINSLRWKLSNNLSFIFMHYIHPIHIKHLVRVDCHKNAASVGLMVQLIINITYMWITNVYALLKISLFNVVDQSSFM